ncbi:hypothetical protein ACVIHH_003005 [Bradyrhizobium sp. USDA 4518]
MRGLTMFAVVPAVIAAMPSAVRSAPIDVTFSCRSSPQPAVYRCHARVTDSATGFPLCIHGATVELAPSSGPAPQEAVRTELSTDSAGEIREIEIKLPNPGSWQLLVRTSGATIVKQVEFRPDGPAAR